MKLKNTLILLSILTLISCSKITIQPEQTFKATSSPNYERSMPFFLWGLVGEERIDVNKICRNKDILQMQTKQTFVDGLIGGITFGIYSPHSVKIWCKN